MNEPVALFEYRPVEAPSALRGSVLTMVEGLRASNRLTEEHEPLAALALKLANALESSGGRGASVALLAAQFREVWSMLSSLPTPIDPDAEVTMEVTLLPVALDEG